LSAISIFTSIKDIHRLRQILSVLAKYGYGHMVKKLGLEESKYFSYIVPKNATMGTDAMRLRMALEELGPTFVKFGQLLSTRSDLIPPEYVEEFSKLQDEVAPFSMREVEEQIRLELGEEITSIFNSFDPVPIASASLSQVHRAVLTDGTMVAVKVQRPGIRPVVETDVDLLYLLARLATKSIPELGLYSPMKLVREFERAIIKELDFTTEAANGERFAKNFRSDADIHFPRVYSDFSGKKVLTMEFIEGVKITEAREIGLDPTEVACIGLRAVMNMVFRDGFFHSDPHPANVFVSEGPVLHFLDLGQVGRVSDEVKDKMLLLMLAISREDFDEVVKILSKIGIKEDEVDMNEFRQDVLDICDRHFGKQLKYIELRGYIMDLLEGAFRYKIRIPYQYTLMSKALITMEGVGKALDPDINIFEEAQPYLAEIFKERYSPMRLSKELTKGIISLSSAVGEAPHRLRAILESIEEGRFKLKIEDLGARVTARTWERIANRLIVVFMMSVAIAASLVLILVVGTGFARFLGVLGLISAALMGLYVMFSILGSGRP